MKQRIKVFEFIKSEIKNGRPFPKAAAIRDHMGWKNASSVSDVLWALVRDGYLTAQSHGRNPNFKIAM